MCQREFLKNKEKSIQVELVVENVIQKEIKVPINMQNQNGEYIYNIDFDDVTLLIRGIESQINQIDLKQFIATVDVAGLTEGEHVIPVRVSKPENFELVVIEPEKIKVKISKR
ncbi:CdaR family protein [Caloramator sp. mosi_1]|uniref:CdaR family protein n=1 Tax=Caloramator sp. mosi_1 TaxID=3023090 RepID=UPI0023612C90|nr:CdaR family protein [Caloramator sp. mosi_1]WDC83617.1 CdaR family protein [Caloramator sp. mosi_1]